MHIHILGVCGTFMAGIALLARSLGHTVTGSDQNVYPPMSTLLEKEGITVIQGYHADQLTPVPDLLIVGNVMKRGNPCVEAMLNNNIPYVSAPQWLHDNILRDRWVIAVAGTHGKTTTAGMVNWILESCGYQQGFIIGGIPGNFSVSARLGKGPFFVIEADEYDCAFFDKRSKFMHYCPNTLLLNNLEFDHADIFNSLNDIKKQFQYLIRLVPGSGKILLPQDDVNLNDVLSCGCWSESEYIKSETGWQAIKLGDDAQQFNVLHKGNVLGKVNWQLVGEHNMQNALMAIAAAHHVGISVTDACLALSDFINAKRRLELVAEVNHIQIYDDFAHHPTAIKVTLEALRSKVGGKRRILAVLEPRSNTMKLGINKDELVPVLAVANMVFLYQPEQISWSVADIVVKLQQSAYWSDDIDKLVDLIANHTQPEDVILVMSNGAFGGIYQKLATKLNNLIV